MVKNPHAFGRDMTINATAEWEKFLQSSRRKEKEYFFFSVRMMSYGFGLTFLSVFFLLKLGQKLMFYEQVMQVFYAVAFMIVMSMMITEVRRFKRTKS